MRRLPKTSYLSFPLRMDSETARSSGRADHVREQIAQLLLTAPRERVFRPEFGAGVQQLVFEPNAPGLWEVTRKRLISSLIEVLRGEVDPKTIEVTVEGREGDSRGVEQMLEAAGGDVTRVVGEILEIRVGYRLAAIGEREEHLFRIGTAGGSLG